MGYFKSYLPFVLACKISSGLNTKGTQIPTKSMFKLLSVMIYFQSMCIVTSDFKPKNKRIALVSKMILVLLSWYIVIRIKVRIQSSTTPDP